MAALGLADHACDDDEERDDLERIRDFVARHENPFERSIAEGHLTGSAIVVAEDGRRVLLLHHLKLDRWLQPGGHADPEESLGEEVALREAREETSIGELRLHPDAPRPLDVDVHRIPARHAESEHDHLDLRYLVIAPTGAELQHRPEESLDLRWFDWEELPDLGLDRGLLRALAKARRIVGG